MGRCRGTLRKALIRTKPDHQPSDTTELIRMRGVTPTQLKKIVFSNVASLKLSEVSNVLMKAVKSKTVPLHTMKAPGWEKI
jgi:hypothetical protein